MASKYQRTSASRDAAGTPTTVVAAGTSFVTTAPTPIRASSPTRMRCNKPDSNIKGEIKEGRRRHREIEHALPESLIKREPRHVYETHWELWHERRDAEMVTPQILAKSASNLLTPAFTESCAS